jgi:hypothetical protein
MVGKGSQGNYWFPFPEHCMPGLLLSQWSYLLTQPLLKYTAIALEYLSEPIIKELTFALGKAKVAPSLVIHRAI